MKNEQIETWTIFLNEVQTYINAKFMNYDSTFKHLLICKAVALIRLSSEKKLIKIN